MSCPKCSQKTLTPVVYDKSIKYAYNGVSEINCSNCGYRECKFCHKELTGAEKAPFGCNGSNHPLLVEL